MKIRNLMAGSVVALLTGSAVALAHDAEPTMPHNQAHQIGRYKVVDEVTHDIGNETTTASYRVGVPHGAQDLGHLSLQLAHCEPPHSIDNTSRRGQINPKGDRSTDTPGPVLKWPAKQGPRETKTYSYTVEGLFEPEEGELVLKSGDIFRGTVQRISCNRREPLLSGAHHEDGHTPTAEIPPQSDDPDDPAPTQIPGLGHCQLYGPNMTNENGGTLITVELTCESDSGSRTMNFGYPSDTEHTDPTNPDRDNVHLGPLVNIEATVEAGIELTAARITDRLYSEDSGRSAVRKYKKEIWLNSAVIVEACVGFAGTVEVCTHREPTLPTSGG